MGVTRKKREHWRERDNDYWWDWWWIGDIIWWLWWWK